MGASRAAGDVAAIKAAGFVFGVNSGVGTQGNTSFSTVTSHFRGAMTGSQAAGWSGILSSSVKAGWDVPESDVAWLSMNIEPTALVNLVVRNNWDAATDVAVPTSGSGNIDLPWFSTASPTQMTRQIMGEVALRSGGTLAYSDSSPTLLVNAGGTTTHVPTYKRLHDAMKACLEDAAAWLRGTSSGGPGWTGSIVHDWRQGVHPMPFGGSGWYQFPSGVSQGYYVPNRTASDHVVSHVPTTGSTLSPWTPNGTYASNAAHLGHVVNKSLQTSRNSGAIWRNIDAITASFYFEPASVGIQAIDAAFAGVSGKHLEVGIQTGEATFKWPSLLLPEADAKAAIKAAARATWLGSWRHMGPHSGLWINGSFGFNYGSTPFWGLSSSNADLQATVLSAITDPVTSTEASSYGLGSMGVQAGDVLMPGHLVVWNATDYYLRSLFSNDAQSLPGGIYPSLVIDGQQVGHVMARANLERRSQGRTSVTPAWTNRLFATNQWYQALGEILTDDLISRCEAIRDHFQMASVKAAARRTRLQVLA